MSAIQNVACSAVDVSSARTTSRGTCRSCQNRPRGRHPDSDIFLDDATVSRRHVEFRLENGQFLLVDLDSLNNTYVNHEPIDSAVLVDGDEIQIGKFRLVFLTRPTTG